MRLRDNDANFGIGTLAFEARASGERVMWGVQPPLRRGASVITLVACVGFAAAQSGRRGVGDTDASAMDETTGSVASPGGERAGLALSDEQRGRIYERMGFKLIQQEAHDTFGKELIGETWELVSRFRSSHHCAAASFANFGIEGH